MPRAARKKKSQPKEPHPAPPGHAARADPAHAAAGRRFGGALAGAATAFLDRQPDRRGRYRGGHVPGPGGRLGARPGPKAAVAKASALLRDAREAAGLTLDDLGAALDLKDPSFMALVESGKVGLPFEMILRMATLLGRNDPITFVLQLTRSYNPRVLEIAGGSGRRKAAACRPAANASSPTSTAATPRRANFPTTTLPLRWPLPPRPSKALWCSWAWPRRPAPVSPPELPRAASARLAVIFVLASQATALDFGQGREAVEMRRSAKPWSPE